LSVAWSFWPAHYVWVSEISEMLLLLLFVTLLLLS